MGGGCWGPGARPLAPAAAAGPSHPRTPVPPWVATAGAECAGFHLLCGAGGGDWWKIAGRAAQVEVTHRTFLARRDLAKATALPLAPAGPPSVSGGAHAPSLHETRVPSVSLLRAPARPPPPAHPSSSASAQRPRLTLPRESARTEARDKAPSLQRPRAGRRGGDTWRYRRWPRRQEPRDASNVRGRSGVPRCGLACVIADGRRGFGAPSPARRR